MQSGKKFGREVVQEYQRGAMQRGYVFKSNGAWFLRFYEKQLINGATVNKQQCERLAPINDDYRSKRDLEPLIERILSPLNRGSVPEGSLTFAEFFKQHFLPHVTAKRNASTVKFYKDAFKNHLERTVGPIRLRDFTTAHAQSLLDGIDLSHQSVLRIKTAIQRLAAWRNPRPTLDRLRRPKFARAALYMAHACWRYKDR